MRDSLLAGINRARKHPMGKEQRNYGRELHTNEFDVCQDASAVSVSDLFLSGLLCNWGFAFSW